MLSLKKLTINEGVVMFVSVCRSKRTISAAQKTRFLVEWQEYLSDDEYKVFKRRVQMCLC